MLADLGQRGGILRLVGKLALLWGGIRGAMSLIGKLITFLRLSERPLYQRGYEYPLKKYGLELTSAKQ
nr:alpha/beta hydrolase fold protein [Tanacetum cinerariifolium]